MPPAAVIDYWILVRLSMREHDWLCAEAARWRTTCGRVAEWSVRRRTMRARTRRESLAHRHAYYLLVGLRDSDYAWLALEAGELDSNKGRILERALRAERWRVRQLLGLD